ncbi:MAG: hypothetical protein D6753_09090 [Planctomycetota bacterium]|nr:MAG: hypothetical protein D6753_09090 [Planctomycetota bacterium]
MPVKVKCPKCGKVLSVPDAMAGKKGKCKCGQVLKIPAGSAGGPGGDGPPAGQAPAGINPAIFDELAAEDFERTAPIDKLFAPQVEEKGSERLQRLAAEEKEKMQQEATKTKMMLKFMAVLNILSAVGYGALAGMLISNSGPLDDIKSFEPIAALNTNVVIGFSIAWCIVLLASAVGGFLGHRWGWFLLAVTYTFLLVDRTGGLVLTLMEGFDQVKFYGALIPTLVALGFFAFLFRGQTREVFGFETLIVPALAGLLGLAIAGGLIGALVATRDKSDSTALAAPPAVFATGMRAGASVATVVDREIGESRAALIG